MKLWNKDANVDELIEAFTVGDDKTFDVRSARWDVVGSIAHAGMLGNVGLITTDEANTLIDALSEMLNDIDEHGFAIEDGVEDVHSQVEKILTERLGDLGKKIHTGRSRNDQVLVDLKLFLRHELRTLRFMALDTAEVLLNQADKHTSTLLPGYTHFQIAMPSSFGLWFGGHAESLIEDARFLKACIDAANANPLGTAAGFGSSLPLDRQQTTDALNFERMHVTSTFAQMSRGRTEHIASMGIAMVASSVARFAMDAVLYSGQNFGFISLPDSFTTGSSIMPHKMNPDVLEVLRARCNRLQALPAEIRFVMGNLPSGYHRDMQCIKDRIIPALDEMKLCLDVLRHVVANIVVKQDVMSDPLYRYAFTVDKVNQLVADGLPFRDAYHQVAEEVRNNQFSFTPDHTKTEAHIGSISNPGLDVLRERISKSLIE